MAPKTGDLVRLSAASHRMCGTMHDDPIRDAVGVVTGVVERFGDRHVGVNWVGPGRVPPPTVLASHLEVVKVVRAE